MGKITTLLFDCDNTLVLSEHLAFEACAELMNTICEDENLEIRFTGETLIKEFVGMNFRGMLTELQKRYDITIEPSKLEEYIESEMHKVIAKFEKDLVACPGVDEQLAALQGKYKMAVVSSSAKPRLLASVKKVGQDKYFPEDLLYSAATSLPKPTSKPNPAIYNFAMEQLGAKPEESVAIEDSKSGTGSGFNAGIIVVGYTGPYPDGEKAEMAQALTDAGAAVIMDDWAEFPAVLAKIDAGEVTYPSHLKKTA